MEKNLEKRVETLEKIVMGLVSKNVAKIKGNLGIGDSFELCGLKWTILEISDNGYMCLADRLKESMVFDSSCNDWKPSKLRDYLNRDFYNMLCEAVGAENVVPFERDLISLDGQTDYGKCEDNVSLLTFDEYRRNRKNIQNTEDYWWWTVTPHSTDANNDTRWVAVVSSSGDFVSGSYSIDYGVRPVCIFGSSIFESEE